MYNNWTLYNMTLIIHLDLNASWYFTISDHHYCSLLCLFVEPETVKYPHQTDTGAVVGKGRLSASEESRAHESKSLTVSSSHLDRTEARISSSAHESRCKILIHVHEYHCMYSILSYSLIYFSLIRTPIVSQQESSHWQEFLSTNICC